jgi:hypothetical protein
MKEWRVVGIQVMLVVKIVSKKLGKMKIDDVDAKVKKTFLKRPEDVFSYKSGAKDAYVMDGIC